MDRVESVVPSFNSVDWIKQRCCRGLRTGLIDASPIGRAMKQRGCVSAVPWIWSFYVRLTNVIGLTTLMSTELGWIVLSALKDRKISSYPS